LTRIDLNCDMGELPEQIADGAQDALMAHVTSVNVACGGHAGDDTTMEATVRSALALGRVVGAHPGFPDREAFGRRPMAMTAAEIADTVHRQIDRLAAIAARCGAVLRHVKPHGALYNLAVDDADLAGAIAAGVARFSRDVVLVGLAGSPSLEVYARAGFRVAAEAFADRRYEADGRLRARVHSDALLFDPAEAAEQALLIAAEGIVVARGGSRLALRADTLCLHGDTPGAIAIAAAVAARLEGAGVALAPLPLD
jgi:UPF0271 protein